MNQINYIGSNKISTRKTYTVKEIAQILNMSERTIYHLCNTTNNFRVLKIGKSIRIHKESFDKWFYN